MMTLEQACSLYLGIHHLPTGDLRSDLITSGKVAARWRRIGPEATATILHALNKHHDMSHRQIEDATGIPSSTVGDLIRKLESGHWDEASHD